MAMPQVHIVAYCGDLGYGVARGAGDAVADAGLGIISRIGCRISGRQDRGIRTTADRLGRARLALLFYLFFEQP